MKQLKFLMAALLMVMGVTLSSCLDSGDDNPIKEGGGIVKFEGGLYGGGVFKAFDGTLLEPSDPLLTMGLTSNKMYSIEYTYNINEVVKGEAIKITLSKTPVDINGPAVISFEEASESNAPMYALELEYGYYKYFPSMFDKNTLILPAWFWVKDVTKDDFVNEIKKHRIEIAYDEVKEGVLNLYINHVITADTETARSKFTLNTYAYDLQSIVSDAANGGATINKIILHSKVNEASNSLKDATDKTFEIDYSKVK